MVGFLTHWFTEACAEEGHSWVSQALSLPGARQRSAARAKALWTSGEMARQLGDLAGAMSAYEESAAIALEVGDHVQHARSLINRGALMGPGSTEGEVLLRRGAELAQAHESWWVLVWALDFLAQVAIARGDFAEAQSLLSEGLLAARKQKQAGLIATMLSELGMLAYARGADATALAFYVEAEQSIPDTESVRVRTEICNGLGHLALRRGEPRAAAAWFEQGLRLSKAHEWVRGIIYHLDGLACVASLHGSPEQGARLAGAVSSLHSASGEARQPVHRAAAQQAERTCRTILGEERFAAAWAVGQTLTREQAMAEALLAVFD